MIERGAIGSGRSRDLCTSSVSDFRLFLLILAALSLTRLGLIAFGFKRVAAVLDWLARGETRGPFEDEAVYIGRVRRLLRRAKRKGPYRGNCLSRSLVLWWLLRRKGIESKLRIGTSIPNGEFRAHAWVEYRGQALNASRRVRERYVVFEHDFITHSETNKTLNPQ